MENFKEKKINENVVTSENCFASLFSAEKKRNIRIIVVSRLFACFAQFFFIDCFKSISNAFYHYIKYKFVFKLCFHALSLDTFVDFA